MHVVAAGILPAVEPGVSPGEPGRRNASSLGGVAGKLGRQDATLYGRRDARRYSIGSWKDA